MNKNSNKLLKYASGFPNKGLFEFDENYLVITSVSLNISFNFHFTKFYKIITQSDSL